MAGGTVAALFVMPFIMVFSIFGGFISELFGKNLSEVVLPYEPEKGIVWEYDDFANRYFHLKEVNIEGDTQVFVFEAYTLYDLYFGDVEEDVQAENEHYVWGGYWELNFTDENGDSMVYYINPNYTVLGIKDDAMKIYAPGEYVKWEYTPVPDDPRFEYQFHGGEKNEYEINEVDGQTVITYIKIPSFNEGETFDINFYSNYTVRDMSAEDTLYYYSEYYTVTFKMEDGEMVVANKAPAIYRCRTIINGDNNGPLVPISHSEVK